MGQLTHFTCESMKLSSIFPTPVGISQFNEPFPAALIDKVYQFKTQKNFGNTRSVNDNVLSEPVFERINLFINDALNDYFQQVYRPKETITPYITQSWISYTSGGQHHHKHVHGNSFISGVFYIQTNDHDSICFHNDTYKTLNIPTENFNLFNSEVMYYPVRESMLLLFPSSTTHSVDTIGDDCIDRISLAFNTFVRGNIGSKNRLTELIL